MTSPDRLSTFSIAESYAMMRESFDIYQATSPAPDEAQRGWIRDDNCGIWVYATYVEHPEAVEGREAQAWFLLGERVKGRKSPVIETMTELDEAADLDWALSNYSATERDVLTRGISRFAYYMRDKTKRGVMANQDNFTLWGITGKRKWSREELSSVDVQAIAEHAYAQLEN